MRTVSIALGCFIVATTACSVSTSPNSVTFKTQTKFKGDPVTKTATADWTGQAIQIENTNGDVTVQGDASVTKVTVTAVPVAYADDQAHSADAQATIGQVAGTILVDESGGSISVRCGKASSQVGTSGTSTTGCESFVVKVPSGSATAGLALAVVAHNGSLTVKNLTSGGAPLDLHAENGSLDASGITGSANVKADNGNLTASLVPTKGATIAVSTGNGDVGLSLPADFATAALALKAGKGITVTGFTDVTATTTSRNPTAANAAASIAVTASDLGALTLKSQ